MTSRIRRLGLGITFAALAACEATGPNPRVGFTLAPVYFQLDAPLCSSVLPVQFSIDNVLVGTDTFRVNLANPHTLSRGFATPLGARVLSARVIGGYVWTDTTVMLTGSGVTRMLPFYCS